MRGMPWEAIQALSTSRSAFVVTSRSATFAYRTCSPTTVHLRLNPILGLPHLQSSSHIAINRGTTI